jgi:hypothetical protein
MSAIARYLLVFLLGWAGAVWSYSDIIYKGSQPAQKIKLPQEANDISLPKELKLPLTSSGQFTSSKKMTTPTINISGNKKSTETSEGNN